MSDNLTLHSSTVPPSSTTPSASESISKDNSVFSSAAFNSNYINKPYHLKKYNKYNIALWMEDNEELREKADLFDIVSDLHIDQWDSSLSGQYLCGQVKDVPYQFPNSDSRILIVAGDISDDIDLSLQYLNDISNQYDKILFVDGNHEHVGKYPLLISTEDINKKVLALENPKLIYLPKNNYMINKTVFLGFCGWWDYDSANEESLLKAEEYFNSWMPHLDVNDSKIFCFNVMSNYIRQFALLEKQLIKYQSDSNIEQIVIVSHTVPLKKFALEKKGDIRTSSQLQTDAFKLLDGKYSKISTWIFGHTHHQFDEFISTYDVRFIAQPRGRPEDFDRTNYKLKKVKLNTTQCKL